MFFLRKILFYIFTAVYLILCPLIILYAFGVLSKPGVEKGVVKASSLYLSTIPSGASIYMGNSRFSQKTPARIENVLEGTYEIKLVLEGYKPWVRKVRIRANQPEVYDKILLIPDEWKKEKLSSDSFEKLLPIASSRFFILQRSLKLKDYFSFDCQRQKLTPFIEGNSSLLDLEVRSYFEVSGSPVLILCLESFEGKKFLWAEQESEYVRLKDITSLFPEEPSYIEWDPKDANHLFSFQNNYLNHLDLVNNKIYPKYVERVRGYGIFDKKIYILEDINKLLRMDYNRQDSEILLADPILGNFLFGKKGFFKVKPLGGDIIIFLGEKGELLSNYRPHRIVERGVKGVAFHPQSKRVLLWLKDKIGIIDFGGKDIEKGGLEKGLKTFWFYTKGRDISQGFWVYQGSHVLMKDADRVFLFEFIKGEASSLYILNVQRGSSVHYCENTGKLYYLEPNTGRLCSLEVVPKHKGNN